MPSPRRVRCAFRPEFVESFLAINKLGAIAVPVNFRMTAPEIAFLVGDCDARVVITESVLARVATAVRDLDPTLATVVVAGSGSEDAVLDYEALLAEDAKPHPLVDIPNESPALIMYTSGTTGHPKGAVLTHTNLAGQAMTFLFTNGVDLNNDVGFIGVPLFHIAGIGNMIIGLLLGLPTVIYPLGAFEPGVLLDVLEAEKVTAIFLVPAQWQAVCAAQQAQPRDLRLRVLSWGAAPAPDSLLRQMSDTFPGTQILAAFGQTEMSPVTCMLLGDDAIRKLGSVGKVIPTVAARVVDDDMNDVAVGEVGEIVYRAPTLMARLLEQPAGHRGGLCPRLVPLGRSGAPGRRGLRLGGRPQEGHDHFRRREHLLRRGRERSGGPSGNHRSGCDRPSARAMGRSSDRRCGRC